MGLTGTLLRVAARRPHVLVAELPGATAARLAVERAVRRRGWPRATSPADADVVIEVCPAAVAHPSLERLWSQVPRPRARERVTDPGRADEALDRTRAVLATAGEPPGSPPDGADPGALAELPMADRGPDRDGLALDLLHVPLGPLLPSWPAGLVLRTTVQGDVLRSAGIELVRPGRIEPFWAEPWLRAARGERVTRGDAARRRCARHLDSLARLLDVAGWDTAASRSRLLRDEALIGGSADRVASRLRGLRRRLSRSRVLHWMTAGLGTPPAGDRDRFGADVAARWRRWLSLAEDDVPWFDSPAPLREEDPPGGDPAVLDLIPELVTGAELTGARLVVASFDPDVAELAESERVHD